MRCDAMMTQQQQLPPLQWNDRINLEIIFFLIIGAFDGVVSAKHGSGESSDYDCENSREMMIYRKPSLKDSNISEQNDFFFKLKNETEVYFFYYLYLQATNNLLRNFITNFSMLLLTNPAPASNQQQSLKSPITSCQLNNLL